MRCREDLSFSQLSDLGFRLWPHVHRPFRHWEDDPGRIVEQVPGCPDYQWGRVFAQETQGRVLGWGTPWHGSSPYCENASVPVSALIVLRQAKKNTIRELSGFEKVTAVSRHVIYPTWLENGMELCLETLDHLLTALPVYELSCRPDEDAVRLTEEKIFGNL